MSSGARPARPVRTAVKSAPGTPPWAASKPVGRDGNAGMLLSPPGVEVVLCAESSLEQAGPPPRPSGEEKMVAGTAPAVAVPVAGAPMPTQGVAGAAEATAPAAAVLEEQPPPASDAPCITPAATASAPEVSAAPAPDVALPEKEPSAAVEGEAVASEPVPVLEAAAVAAPATTAAPASVAAPAAAAATPATIGVSEAHADASTAAADATAVASSTAEAAPEAELEAAEPADGDRRTSPPGRVVECVSSSPEAAENEEPLGVAASGTPALITMDHAPEVVASEDAPPIVEASNATAISEDANGSNLGTDGCEAGAGVEGVDMQSDQMQLDPKEALNRMLKEKQKELLKLKMQAKEKQLAQLRGRLQDKRAAPVATTAVAPPEKRPATAAAAPAPLATPAAQTPPSGGPVVATAPAQAPAPPARPVRPAPTGAPAKTPAAPAAVHSTRAGDRVAASQPASRLPSQRNAAPRSRISNERHLRGPQDPLKTTVSEDKIEEHKGLLRAALAKRKERERLSMPQQESGRADSRAEGTSRPSGDPAVRLISRANAVAAGRGSSASREGRGSTNGYASGEHIGYDYKESRPPSEGHTSLRYGKTDEDSVMVIDSDNEGPPGRRHADSAGRRHVSTHAPISRQPSRSWRALQERGARSPRSRSRSRSLSIAANSDDSEGAARWRREERLWRQEATRSDAAAAVLTPARKPRRV